MNKQTVQSFVFSIPDQVFSFAGLTLPDPKDTGEIGDSDGTICILFPSVSDKETFRKPQGFYCQDGLRRIVAVANLYFHSPFFKQPFRNVASVSVPKAPASQCA